MTKDMKYTEFDSASNSTHNLIVGLISAGSHVLEMGCATGYMSKVLKEQLGCSVTGVEISSHAAELAREHCERVINADAETLDLTATFGEEKFDVILFADVLEHMRDPGALLHKLQPLLAKGGSIIASIPNIAHGSVRLALLGGEFRYQETGLLDNTHLRFFTRESVQSLFEDAGYLITQWVRQRIELDQTEIAIPALLSPEIASPIIMDMINQDPEAMTYQFIVKAVCADVATALRQARAEIAAASAEHKLALHLQQSEYDKTFSALRAELDEKEELIQSFYQQNDQKIRSLPREEETSWLRSEVAKLRASETAVEALKKLVEKNEQIIQAQSEQITHLNAALADERRTVQALEEQTSQQQQIILSREEGIAWLQNELNGLMQAKRGLSFKRAETTPGLANSTVPPEKSFLLQRLSAWLALQGPYWRFRRLIKQLFFPVMPNRFHNSLQQVFRHSIPEQTKTEPAGLHPAMMIPKTSEEKFAGQLTLAVAADHQTMVKKGDFFQQLTLLPHFEQSQTAGVLDHDLPAQSLHKADVICFSIVDWETRYQRPQQLMSQFGAHGHRVFYISTTRFQSASTTQPVAVRLIKENVYEVSLAAQYQPDVYGEAISGNNQAVLLASLDELRRTFQIDEAIGFVQIASWGNVAMEAQKRWGWRIIYDCMDEWENFPGIKQPVLNLEKRLVETCDLLVVTAQRLYEKWQGRRRHLVLARNATDYQFYSERCQPNDILKTAIGQSTQPVVGYFGAIADWFDVELMAYIARSRPQYTFVLLGGVFDVDVSSLKALSNVRLLGQQPYETMPEYLYHFDVCIIPFKINPITEATDPVKLYEYFSGGKPVVSVALPEVAVYREYVYLAENKEEFVAKLDEAIAENNPLLALQRQELAKRHTWESRYEQIEAGLVEATPRATIIIVTYNNLVLNKLCLESVIRNTQYPNYEVIVVDNNSADETPAYLRQLATQYKNIKVVLNPTNNGFARANNQGIAQSTGEYLILLNNDTIVPPGWLSRLLLHLRNPAIGMVGPVTNFVGNEAKIEVPYLTWNEMEAFAQEHTWANDGKVADIHMLAMFCVAFRRETYDSVGQLDEQFGIGMFEDDDYARRVREHGLRVICAADVFVHHFGQAAFKKLIENGQYNDLFNENRRRYETKWNVKWMPRGHSPVIFERVQSSSQ